jgi:murein DD-endopeptidase MepM/ murein hydrolase activator NlpD
MVIATVSPIHARASFMSFKERTPRYAELSALALFLALLGYLVLTTAPEQALQTATVRSGAPERAPVEETVSSPDATPSPAPRPQPPARDDFRFAKAPFAVEQGRIEQGQTFADLLTDAGVDYPTVLTLVEKARPDFDVRRLQAGKRYRIYRRDGEARYFVYQRGPVRYVALGLDDSLVVREGKRPITTTRRTASGVVQHSLYEALGRADAHPELALALSEVYAWQIDFYRLRPGDAFDVIYDEERVGGRSVGIDRVVGVRFEHRGDSYYGLNFDEEYFDEKGRSLRKSLLLTPLKFARVSSHYQKSRYHPVLKKWRAHLGTDYAAAPGTPVYAVGDGRITRAKYGKYNGNNVKVRHNDTYTTQYLHFSKIADGIEPGARVKQKQVIGYVGETGLATGPHCHYILYKNGEPVNPYKQTLPSAPPVADSLRADYDRLKAQLLPQLRSDSAQPRRAAAGEPAVPVEAFSLTPSLPSRDDFLLPLGTAPAGEAAGETTPPASSSAAGRP